MAESFSSQAGYGISQPHPYTIPTGQVTAVEAVLDLGRAYGFVIIAVANVSGAAAPTDTISIRLGYDTDGILAELNGDDGAAIAHEIGSSGVGFFRRYFVGAARRVQLVLSAAADGDIDFVILGVDAALMVAAAE